MTDRPILFSAPMVRALLDGSKTQTRRVVKPQPPEDVVRILVDKFHPIKIDRYGDSQPGLEIFGAYDATGSWGLSCPHGQPGSKLWVRETWGYIDPDCSGQDVEGLNDDGVRGGPCRVFHDDMMREGSVLRDYWRRRVAYAASWQEPKFDNGPDAPKRWRPSIHMPRWASRITLDVTGVRVERLQDISIEDAKAEGAWGPNESVVGKVMEYFGIDVFAVNPINAYQMLWESINGPGSWAANPWVWVIEFRRAAIGGAK